ncbi:putative MFS general substrate transporter [Lyophyllum shimeji]|uniref:MFS general substrate transporter n=1 Tax=Lyophyllum shimeji TaxID=47721 RepID=A0A9P3PJM2_LYOSH|nr:putative MFS general substrate transporter [Lyophyllum shimeji]
MVEKSEPSGCSPLGLRWRSSYWFTTFTVGLGIATDLVVYTVIIPVMPFQLQKLGYSEVSALTGWLLFAYSAGLVLSTIPIAVFSERYSTRRMPLLLGLVILLGSQILLMEARIYAVMFIARVLQGIGSSMVWVVGLALLCDVSPEHLVGRQLGIAMGGLSAGTLVGPPVGGALYSRFGFRGPFIFGLAAAVLDLVARLLIVERNDALKWGVDPKATDDGNVEEGNNKEKSSAQHELAAKGPQETSDKEIVHEQSNSQSRSSPAVSSSPPQNAKPLFESLITVILKLFKSSRALAAILITFVYGVVDTSQEPSLPLHLQSVWGLDSGKVGLVFLASVVPTLLSSPLAGWLTDKKGAEVVSFVCLVLSIPWWVVVIIQGPLALFIVALAVEIFFTSGLISPLTAELAAVSQSIEGVGYAHVYGAFNVAYGVGSAVGPLVGGQIYDHAKHGWMALCLLAVGLIVSSLVLALFNTGADPLSGRLKRVLSRRSRPANPA